MDKFAGHDEKGRMCRRPFRFINLGVMAYLGDNKALTQIDFTKNQQLRLSGEPAFLLWRSVYITKQVRVYIPPG